MIYIGNVQEETVIVSTFESASKIDFGDNCEIALRKAVTHIATLIEEIEHDVKGAMEREHVRYHGNQFLKAMMDGRELYMAHVTCDMSNNKQQDIDNGQIIATLGIMFDKNSAIQFLMSNKPFEGM